MNRNSQFWYAIKNTQNVYKRPEKFLAFLPGVKPISHYCLSGQPSLTRGSLADTNSLMSESSDFQYHAEVQSSKISLLKYQVTNFITSLHLPS